MGTRLVPAAELACGQRCRMHPGALQLLPVNKTTYASNEHDSALALLKSGTMAPLQVLPAALPCHHRAPCTQTHTMIQWLLLKRPLMPTEFCNLYLCLYLLLLQGRSTVATGYPQLPLAHGHCHECPVFF
jgi:hypothetical protein